MTRHRDMLATLAEQPWQSDSSYLNHRLCGY